MKKILFKTKFKTINLVATLAILMIYGSVSAQDNPFYVKIIGEESIVDSVNQEIKAKFHICAKDTLDFDSVEFFVSYPNIPTSSGFSSENKMLSSTWNHLYSTLNMLPGDSISDSLTLNFNKTNIPFYYKLLEIKSKNTNDDIISTCNLYIYFTPYKTVEVWGIKEFEKLKRIWNYDDEQQNLTRVLADSSELPVSDLDSIDFNNDSIPKSYFSHPALSYLVPKHKVLNTFEVKIKNQVK